MFWKNFMKSYFFLKKVSRWQEKHEKLPSLINTYLTVLQLITIANRLDPDQDRQNVGPDLGLNCLTLWNLWKVNFEKNSRWHQKHEKFTSMQCVNPNSAEPVNTLHCKGLKDKMQRRRACMIKYVNLLLHISSLAIIGSIISYVMIKPVNEIKF